jgi:signal transduction histidine kinase
MDEEALARAFEPYFSTKGHGRGTGLGLASVYGTVQDSGGEVRLESLLGSGTTVRILLPRTVAGDELPA